MNCTLTAFCMFHISFLSAISSEVFFRCSFFLSPDFHELLQSAMSNALLLLSLGEVIWISIDQSMHRQKHKLYIYLMT